MHPIRQHCLAVTHTVPISAPDLCPALDRLTNLQAMTGYSGTTLAKKLGIKPGFVVRISHQPGDLEVLTLIAPLPEGARVTRRAGKHPPDVVLCFAETAAELATRLPQALGWIAKEGSVWVCWPKMSSARFRTGVRDLTEDTIRTAALAAGVVDVKVCAIDDTWSGLKLVYRLTARK